MKRLGTKLVLIFLLVFVLAIGSNTATAARPVPKLNVVLQSIVGLTATIDVSWSKYPVYRCSAVANVYLDAAGTSYSGYMIGMGDVINDGRTHRSYSVTGFTVVFGQNCGISPNVQPISGKYCKIAVQVFDKNQTLLGYAESNVMQIP